jgi:hypothetical protein
VKALFLDESGDHSLTVIDKTYPLFILGGILVDVDYSKGEMTERLSNFKRETLGSDQIILHTADMVRNRKGFEGLANPGTRASFYAALNALLSDLKFEIVACAIRKQAHLNRYGDLAQDPYHFALEVLVERLCYAVGDQKEGGVIVVAEKRDKFLDRKLRLTWLLLKSSGTRFVKAVQVAERIKFGLRGKEDNLAGLQVADLVVTPIGRSLLGKSTLINQEMVQSKFRCNRQGEYAGTGLVVIPKD